MSVLKASCEEESSSLREAMLRERKSWHEQKEGLIEGQDVLLKDRNRSLNFDLSPDQA